MTEYDKKRLDEDERYMLTHAQSHANDFNKTMTTLAAGGIALSITFIEKIAGPNPTATGNLVAAWVLLVLTLTLCIVANYSSSVAFRNHYEVLLGLNSNSEEKQLLSYLGRSLLGMRVRAVCDVAGLVAFIGAVVFLMTFSYANLSTTRQ